MAGDFVAVEVEGGSVVEEEFGGELGLGGDAAEGEGGLEVADGEGRGGGIC